jgi:hypothetical protein
MYIVVCGGSETLERKRESDGVVMKKMDGYLRSCSSSHRCAVWSVWPSCDARKEKREDRSTSSRGAKKRRGKRDERLKSLR